MSMQGVIFISAGFIVQDCDPARIRHAPLRTTAPLRCCARTFIAHRICVTALTLRANKTQQVALLSEKGRLHAGDVHLLLMQ
ncbi:Uncharacterised protein [Campylobacter jejuni]|nr:Uncharacterised protein [Campylobacter jejuni]